MDDQRTHDTLHRRRRDRPQSTDKRVTPQDRDLLWFQKIHEHGPLSSTYLHAFSRHIARNEKRARDRLTDLFNESRTPHGGAYLGRPWQQFQTFDARYQDLVYDLTDASEAALREHCLWHDSSRGHTGPWTHRYMVACITASIELATFDDPTLVYIPQHVILERAGASLRYPVPCLNPPTGKTEVKDLIPDALFGLEYQKDGKSYYRFFVVEADRGTEPSRTQTFNRKSHLRNFLQYREYVGRGLYRDHLKLTAPLLVLNVTTNERAMANMMRLAQSLSGQGNYLLFRTAEQFGRYFKPSKTMPELMDEPWARTGSSTSFLIDQP
ncbi:replication-relaxation family protein [Mesorhizobium sp.]|uniref:replication-relaxation family protein n=1 Tax=Mesorhizobium sp. TaxID=1871066 RepID=UPI000FE516C9|nr:replication-relaxation family protein [Mesorhizobium sp.]RWQ58829.1 MAG: hypothetical protein EOS83_12560 [Mesorhizobium sp.]